MAHTSPTETAVDPWKIGWACGPENLVAAVRTVKQFLTFASGTPFQVAIADALRNRRPWTDELRTTLMARRDVLRRILQKDGMQAEVDTPYGNRPTP